MYLRVIEQGLVSIVSCFDGLSPAEVHAHPIAGANSLAIIVRHSLANAHRNVLASFAGEPYDYHRDAEFVDDGETVASMVATWAELRERMHKALAPFTAADLQYTQGTRAHGHGAGAARAVASRDSRGGALR